MDNVRLPAGGDQPKRLKRLTVEHFTDDVWDAHTNILSSPGPRIKNGQAVKTLSDQQIQPFACASADPGISRSLTVAVLKAIVRDWAFYRRVISISTSSM